MPEYAFDKVKPGTMLHKESEINECSVNQGRNKTFDARKWIDQVELVKFFRIELPVSKHLISIALLLN